MSGMQVAVLVLLLAWSCFTLWCGMKWSSGFAAGCFASLAMLYVMGAPVVRRD